MKILHRIFSRIVLSLLPRSVRDEPTERVVAGVLNGLLEYSNTRTKAIFALKSVQRIHEAAGATMIALENLLSDEVNKKGLSGMMDSVEKLAVKAWSKGEPTPADARHLKDNEDAN